MKTISMPEEEYLEELEKSEKVGYEKAFRRAWTFLKSGKSPKEWLDSTFYFYPTNNEMLFYEAMDGYLNCRDKVVSNTN
jgi:hypothetical protein